MISETDFMKFALATATTKAPGVTHPEVFPLSLLAVGLLGRLGLAYFTFLNPDEALHYLLSVQPSAVLAYEASLTTAHPPLLILWLHYWGLLGKSEVFLRFPSVLAGTVFCWITYRWLQWAVGRNTALIALCLLLFLPPLVFLSAEIRQYAFLLLFMSTSIYLFDRALGKDSAPMVLGSALAVGLALLTHYSALIFALAHAVYALVRILSRNTPRRLAVAWIGGQLIVVALTMFLLKSHVSQLNARGLPQKLADQWLYSSMFHPGVDNLAWFVLKANLRLFHYLCWSSIIGGIALLLFVTGLVILCKNTNPPPGSNRPTSRQLGILLVLPFLINLAAACAGKYPYGGTRHNSFLALFAVAGIGIALARWRTSSRWLVPAGIVLALAVVNFFPAPSGAYIRPKYQARKLMDEATRFLAQSATQGSTILTDQEGGLLLSYYFCPDKVIQLEPSSQALHRFTCGADYVVSPFSRWFVFNGETLPAALQKAASMDKFSLGSTVWFFQAGWLVEKEPDVRVQLANYGCPAPTNFGQNILVCELTLPQRDGGRSASTPIETPLRATTLARK